MDRGIGFESRDWVSQEEFARFCEEHERDLQRYELLNGRIVMNPPPGWQHGQGSVSIASFLADFVKRHGLGRVLAETDTELPSGDTTRPDLSFVSHERWKVPQGAFLGV